MGVLEIGRFIGERAGASGAGVPPDRGQPSQRGAAGLEHATGELATVLNAELTMPPELLERVATTTTEAW